MSSVGLEVDGRQDKQGKPNVLCPRTNTPGFISATLSFYVVRSSTFTFQDSGPGRVGVPLVRTHHSSSLLKEEEGLRCAEESRHAETRLVTERVDQSERRRRPNEKGSVTLRNRV